MRPHRALTAVAAAVAFLAMAWPASAQQIRDVRRHYPEAAREQGVGGTVALECLVGENGRIDCQAASETPAQHGFGDAAIRISRDFRMAPRTPDGAATAGGRVRLCIVFEPGPPARISTASGCNPAVS